MLENINLFADYSVRFSRNDISEQMRGRDSIVVVMPWRHGNNKYIYRLRPTSETRKLCVLHPCTLYIR